MGISARGDRSMKGQQTERKAVPQSDYMCLCGKFVLLADDGVKLHRQNANGILNRKTRKAEWCKVPTIIKAAVETKSASGLPLD